MEIPSRNIIFLQGIFFDQIQTIEDKMISETINRNNNEINNYSYPIQSAIILPMRFKNIKSWKESTKDLKLRCWYCTLSFEGGVPCFIPKHILSGSGGTEFDTFGWFCGFACAYSFLNRYAEFRINKTYFDKLNMLKMLYICFYKKKIMEFYEAPDKYTLTLYGGHLDLKTYQAELIEINKKIMKHSTYIKNN